MGITTIDDPPGRILSPASASWAGQSGARGLAVDVHKHLNAARNATAHIISQGVADGRESMTWDKP